jgi:hypothetical protein
MEKARPQCDTPLVKMKSWDEEFRIIGFAFLQGETMEQTNIVSKRKDPKLKNLSKKIEKKVAVEILDF